MKTAQLIALILFAGFGSHTYASKPALSVKVTNPYSTDRLGEVVEIVGPSISGLQGKNILVNTSTGEAVPSQITYDGKLLLFGDFPSKSTREFSVSIMQNNESAKIDTICVGQIRPEMQDDYAWENDRGGYRLYGPSYRAGGGKVSGYDIWTKSVGYPTLAQRYDDHAHYGMSYHQDFGSGMDVYTVGPTLGAGMNALMVGDSICYPIAYEKCEILDNGPLRVTAKITCYPENICEDRDVVETRIISLDRGDWLNRTSVHYEGLTQSRPITTGIVVHKQNKRAYVIDSEKRYLAYVDLTDNPKNGNGAIFIGIVNPQLPDSISYVPFEKEVADGVGQVQTFSTLIPGNDYTYYWGAGWSKGGVRGTNAWLQYLANFHHRLNTPLQVKIK